MDTVGKRIEALGKAKLQLTGEKLAERLGVSYETLRKWKAGTMSPSAPRQKIISERLGEPPEVYMYGATQVGFAPLEADEVRLIAAYRAMLVEDRADILSKAERRAREIEELTLRVQRQRLPLGPSGKRDGTNG